MVVRGGSLGGGGGGGGGGEEDPEGSERIWEDLREVGQGWGQSLSWPLEVEEI